MITKLLSFFPGLDQKLSLHYFKGDNVHCPVCGGDFITFLPFGRIKRANAQCPRCDSLERHRLQYLYLRNETTIFSRERVKLLHIAPEAQLYQQFRKLPNFEYIPIDKFTEGYAYPKDVLDMDILSLNFPDNSFDVIICNHVLEHIPDDKTAMKELFRVLKPGGVAFLQVPLDKSRDTTYEDFSIKDPKEREIHFGQFDHVRMYGKDYEDRLRTAGFAVNVVDYIEKLGPGSVFKYGLMAEEDIYVCSKN
jgi:predicted SAM-dependent methyltransferase